MNHPDHYGPFDLSPDEREEILALAKGIVEEAGDHQNEADSLSAKTDDFRAASQGIVGAQSESRSAFDRLWKIREQHGFKNPEGLSPEELEAEIREELAWEKEQKS